MCGIAGIAAFSEKGNSFLNKIESATRCLQLRGPDDGGIYIHQQVALGHRRLSVIDTSKGASQPMHDASGRYTIIFNGEFFNYTEHRENLSQSGISFRTHSDTEVLLQLYIRNGQKCLEHVNGFFALAIYDEEEQTLFIARDRVGVKPLLYYHDTDKFFFASEMKALMTMGIPRELDKTSLFSYFQLNYIPSPNSIFKNVDKLQPGSYLLIDLKNKSIQKKTWYNIPYKSEENLHAENYKESQKQLVHLMDQAVQRRLIADVPVGAFLSGGVDSSVIVALASRHVKQLNTFSIGFKDEPTFDETEFAELVAKKYKTNHTVFKLSTNDLYESLFTSLDYLDEPFADSSALAVNLLSKQTRKHVTVALSGDGADELFAGYNKHKAEWIVRNKKLQRAMLTATSPVISLFEGSRSSKISNRVRQIHRFAEGSKLNAKERYWRWCSFVNENEAKLLFKEKWLDGDEEYHSRKKNILQHIFDDSDFNEVLLTDMQLVLVGDMLVKVDQMSMANSLEVRNPFLDFKVVDFAFSLPASYKIDATSQKKIVRDAFQKLLPVELYNRPKKGFEVPLLRWFQTELKNLITNDLLQDDFIIEQGIFNITEIRKLKQQLFSKNPGEIHARIWGLVVFQYWWKKYMI